MTTEDTTKGTGPTLTRQGAKYLIDGVEFVPVATMLDRIAAKHTKLSEAIRQRDEAITARDSAKELAAGAESIRAEFDTYRSGIEQAAAFRAVGLDGDDHETIRARLMRFHSADLSELTDDDDRPSLGAWLEGQREDPVIGHLLPSVPTSAGDAPPVEADAAPAASGVPRVGGGRPPAPQRRLSMPQLQARHREILSTARSAGDPAERARLFESARQLLNEHRTG